MRAWKQDSDWYADIRWKGLLRRDPLTMRELTYQVVMHLPLPNTSRGERWTRDHVEMAIRRVVWEQLFIADFRMDDEFVKDMGLG